MDEDEPFVNPQIPEAAVVDRSKSDDEVIDANMKLMNFQISYILECWPKIRSIRDACNLAATTTQLIEKRTNLLLRPATFTDVLHAKRLDMLSNPKQKPQAAITYDPIED